MALPLLSSSELVCGHANACIHSFSFLLYLDNQITAAAQASFCLAHVSEKQQLRRQQSCICYDTQVGVLLDF